MKYIELFGTDIEADIKEIKREIDGDPGIVFVYSGTGTLYDYIYALYHQGKGPDAYDQGNGLGEDYLYKFKVCYEKKDLKVSYSEGSGRSREIDSMSSLVNELDRNASCRIVVESDDRVQLAFIVQQLIFIEYPLERIDILLRKEEKDADKTKRFMENVHKLRKGCESAITQLTELERKVSMDNDKSLRKERLEDIKGALDSCTAIKVQILKATDVELKFAVAASKKAGKSVIVNCFLGEEIAPTSIELATPNNCIYRKSPDERYHLQLEGSASKDFDTRQQIYDEINARFREAQNDRENKFSLPDMNIEYVTEGNNFSSYTIFDTAGPDAAGTAHADGAEKAMRKCDVAVFAIDYSKYLTTSEEDYLRRVIEIFKAQNKFHSLIFALNKIDIRYNDTETPKSIIMSVDFIKTRLANICDEYRYCIIFPTCSLEYFNAIEAEKAGVTELNAGEELPIGEMKRIKFKYKNIKLLNWLHTHSENLEYYHGIKTISYDVFKKDSGMPALMDYVSYIARSKARDEIVNNITFQISSQKGEIQSVLDYITNIEALINADDEKIGKISSIIEKYEDAVKKILSEKFNGDELEKLPVNSLLGKFKGDYNGFIEHQKQTLAPIYEKKAIAEAVYTATVEKIWTQIEHYKRNNMLITGHKIDDLFSTSDFRKIVKQIILERIEKAASNTYDQLSRLSGEVKKIVKNRQDQLNQRSNDCRQQLEKEHINLELPKPPEFEFVAEMRRPDVLLAELGDIDFALYDKLSYLFKRAFFENVGVYIGKLFGNKTDKDFALSYNKTKSDFFSICESNLKPSIKTAVYENNIADKLRDRLTESVVNQYMKEVIEKLKQSFEGMNSTYKSYIERFRRAIDDRDLYKADIDKHNLRKETIKSIDKCTREFMDTWDSIIEEVETDKSPALPDTSKTNAYVPNFVLV